MKTPTTKDLIAGLSCAGGLFQSWAVQTIPLFPQKSEATRKRTTLQNFLLSVIEILLLRNQSTTNTTPIPTSIPHHWRVVNILGSTLWQALCSISLVLPKIPIHQVQWCTTITIRCNSNIDSLRKTKMFFLLHPLRLLNPVAKKIIKRLRERSRHLKTSSDELLGIFPTRNQLEIPSPSRQDQKPLWIKSQVISRSNLLPVKRRL